MPNNFGLEVLGLVTMKFGRKSIVCEETIKQDFRCCPRRLVPGWDSHGIPSKVICYDQYILVMTLDISSDK